MLTHPKHSSHSRVFKRLPGACTAVQCSLHRIYALRALASPLLAPTLPQRYPTPSGCAQRLDG
eukprot:4316818-Prymnesium_polylepis.1